MQLGLQQPENTGGLTNIFERPIRVPHTREWSLLKTPIFWIQHTLIHDLNLPYHMLLATKPFCVRLCEGISAVLLGRVCHRQSLIGRSDRIGN